MDGHVAIVTGAAQGIGKAIATVLAKRKAAVLVSDRLFEKAEQTAAELIANGAVAAACEVDVASADAVHAMVERVLSLWGRLDVLVNNAGITRDGLILRMKEDDWNTVLSVNLKGTFHTIKAVLPVMSKQRRGRIINISSVVGAMGNAGQANYAASKAAVVGLTKTAAREYASRGITVNAVAPGFIDTAMTASLPAAVRESLLKQIPVGRFGVAEDVAHAVAFLASEEAAYITGQVIHVNGGMYMAS